MFQKFAGILTLVLGVSVGLSQADEKADKILKNAIEAQGGEKVLKELKAMTWEAKGKFFAAGPEAPYTSKYAWQHSKQLRFDINLEVAGSKVEMSAALNGNEGWERAGDKAQKIEGKKLEGFQHNAYTMEVCLLKPLLEKGYTLTAVEDTKVEGAEVEGFKVSSKGHADVTLYFDKKTHLLARSVTKIYDEFSNSELEQINDFSGYTKSADGRQEFKKQVLQRGGKKFMVEEYMNYKVVEKLDAKTFEQPK